MYAHTHIKRFITRIQPYAIVETGYTVSVNKAVIFTSEAGAWGPQGWPRGREDGSAVEDKEDQLDATGMTRNP